MRRGCSSASRQVAAYLLLKTSRMHVRYFDDNVVFFRIDPIHSSGMRLRSFSFSRHQLAKAQRTMPALGLSPTPMLPMMRLNDFCHEGKPSPHLGFLYHSSRAAIGQANGGVYQYARLSPRSAAGVSNGRSRQRSRHPGAAAPFDHLNLEPSRCRPLPHAAAKPVSVGVKVQNCCLLLTAAFTRKTREHIANFISDLSITSASCDKTGRSILRDHHNPDK